MIVQGDIESMIDVARKPFSTLGFLSDSWLRRDAYDGWFATLDDDQRFWETLEDDVDPTDRGPALADRTTAELTARIADLERRKQVIDGESTRLQAQLYAHRLRQYAAEEAGDPDTGERDADHAVQAVEINAHEAAVRDLMPALRLSHRSAAARLTRARRYVDEHPRLLDAYADGTMTWGQRETTREQLDVLTHRAGRLVRDDRTGEGIDVHLDEQVLTPDAIAAATERLTTDAVGHAASLTTAQLKKRLRGRVLAELPTHEPAAVERREKDKYVAFTPCDDDVTMHVSSPVPLGLGLLLDRHLAACADAAADHAARTGVPDPRSHSARRADAFTDMVRTFLRNGAPADSDAVPEVVTVVDPDTGELTDVPVRVKPRSQGGRTHRPMSSVSLHLTVSADTITGRSEEPGEVAGHGHVPAAVARALAAGLDVDADWWTILTAPGSRDVIDVSAKSYRPPAALRRFVQAEHPTCVGYGCQVPSIDCDLDHEVPFDRGGPTVRANLQPRCRREHRWKTQPFLAERRVERPVGIPVPREGEAPPY